MRNLLGIRKTRTTPLHPQSDGMVERFNKTLKDHLAKVVSENQRDWDRHIPIFLMAYRSAEHSTTGESPATVIFGNNIRMPADLKFGTPPGYSGIMSEYVSELQNKLNYVHHLVRKRLRITSDRMKTLYDRRANTAGFQADALVWLYNPKRQKGLSPKLQADWEGPYLVITRINDVVYRIQRHGKPRAKMKVAEQMQVKVVERTQEIAVQEQEMQRREKELEATVRRPAEAEKYRLEKIAEANRNRVIVEAQAEAKS
ncbi:flotillin-1-like [Hermetia illucens]|uniref:flotillin-1-like n=1 Tax=Hermetia illucens TaxID=343691 RepID=UPI0018CC0799|nr:flotillin-1-like [Hermetia illucens]